MSLFEVGRLCVKIAGRDAGRKCVVVENISEGYVVVDGDVRRKKVNVKHLEPLSEMVGVKDKASHEDVKKAFEKLGLAVWERKSKKVSSRPKKVKKVVPKKAAKETKKTSAEKKAKVEKKETAKPKKEEKAEENKEEKAK